MPKTLCKSLRNDGQPCQGLGQPDLEGYCIAHAAPDKVWEWRSRGGKASSAAARADKRIPDRLRGAIEKVSQGMDDLLEGKIEPAALSAIARSARVLVDLYRLADEEMELIRGEEDAAAAAQVVGGFGAPDLLEKAGHIAAWQNQYRIDALIAQGLVTLQRGGGPNKDEAPCPSSPPPAAGASATSVSPITPAEKSTSGEKSQWTPRKQMIACPAPSITFTSYAQASKTPSPTSRPMQIPFSTR